MSRNSLPLLPSPCIGICKLDADREFCIGCLRTVEQIRDWSKLDNVGRLEILQELKIKRDQNLGREPKRRRSRRMGRQAC